MSGRVMRNPRPDAGFPWLFVCATCKGGESGLLWVFPSSLGGAGTWKAPDWQTAQNFAIAHAAEHEATRCPTCHQFPADRSLPKWTCDLCGDTTLLVMPGGDRMAAWEADLLHDCPVRAGKAQPRGAKPEAGDA